MKLKQNERERVASGDVKFLKSILLKESEDLKIELSIFRNDNHYDNFLKGKVAFIQELIKVLEY